MGLGRQSRNPGPGAHDAGSACGQPGFGADWPVCRSVSTFASVVAAAEALIAPLSEDERAEVMGGTATRVYGTYRLERVG